MIKKGIKKTALLLCVLTLILSALPAPGLAEEPDSQTVRVKLSTNNATAIAISLKGEYFIKECSLVLPAGTLTLKSNFNGTVTAVHSTAGELYTGECVSVMRTDMQPSAGYITLNSRRYLGHLYVRALSSGYLQVVNEVPIAHYLYGVVAYEMSNLYPIEALKAQAIAAKSYVLSIISQKPNATYHIGDTSSDQVYKGYNSSYTNVISAVDSTISEVLTVNGKILTAYYSASNGGETTVPSSAWTSKKASDAGFAVALDPYDTANTLSMKETATIPVNCAGQISQQLYDLLIAKLTQYKGTQAEGLNLIRSVELTNPKSSGEQHNMTSITMVVDGIFGGMVEENISLKFNVSELMLYRVFTNSNLRCYWGEYSSDGSSYTIYHVRWGHGVGLSQRGAQQRANDGQSYRTILAFYYPGASLTSYNISIPAAPTKPGATESTATPTPAQSGTTAIDNTAGMISIGTGVTTAKVNIRSGAGTQYEAYKLLPRGTSLTVFDYDNGWYYVKTGDISGFVIDDYVKFTAAKAEEAATPAPEVTPTASGDTTPTPTPGGTTTGETLVVGTVTGSGVNLRTGPDTSYTSIAKLSKNTLIIILSTEGNWTRVIAGENEGYIHSDYVKKTGIITTDGGETSAVPQNGEGETTGSVNLRRGEGTSTDKLATLKKGTKLELISLSNGWYKVSCSAGEGYVSAKYVRVITAIPEKSETKDEEADTDKKEGTVTAAGEGITTGSVNMREEANTQSKILTTLKRNTTVILYSLSNGWYEAECGGKKGYLYAKYVRATTAVPEKSEANETKEEETKTASGEGVTTATVNLRAEANTQSSILIELKRNTTVTLYSLSNGWYKAEYDGKQGYLYAKYVRATTAIPETETKAEETKTAMGEGVTTGTVNMRAEANTQSDILIKLKRGTTVTLYSLSNGWYEAEYDGKHGYLYAKYVKKTSDTVTAQSGDTAGTDQGVTPEGTASGTKVELATGKTSAKVNMRTGASTTGTGVLGTISSGTKLNILAEMGDWYYVLYDGRTGFCSKAYITVQSTGTTGIYKGDTAITLIAATIKSDVNFRTGPDTSYPVIRQLNKGDSAMVYMINGSWCLAKCGDEYGFINKDYVKLR